MTESYANVVVQTESYANVVVQTDRVRSQKSLD